MGVYSNFKSIIMKNFREWLGMIVIVISILALAFVGYSIVSTNNIDNSKFVYSSLLPLVGTWVGVVLAFYFGKENYEAASKRYEKIIDKLSPDLLDDVAVSQVMISKKTMVFKKWSEIKDKSVHELLDFLLEIDKSRLPVIGDDGKVKYIIHSSLLTKPYKNSENEVQRINSSEKLSDFITKHKGIVDLIVLVKDNDILENVRKVMNSKPNCKDVFVENDSGVLQGWLTDTLILRYINSKKI